MTASVIGSLDAVVVGTIVPDASQVMVSASTYVVIDGQMERAETPLIGVLGVGSSLGDTVTFGPDAESCLRFWVSGDGRYGVSLRESGFPIYQQLYQTAWRWGPIESSAVRLRPNSPLADQMDATCRILPPPWW